MNELMRFEKKFTKNLFYPLQLGLRFVFTETNIVPQKTHVYLDNYVVHLGFKIS